jgi:hypothetical protein
MSVESESYKKCQVHQDLWILGDFPDVTLVCDDARPAYHAHRLACPTRPHHLPLWRWWWWGPPEGPTTVPRGC